MSQNVSPAMAIASLESAADMPAVDAPPPSPVTDQETELGNAVYQELKTKGEIIASSPLYSSLTPVASAITRVAQPHYEHPFKFYLIHDPTPNAASVPGGAIYVTDALLYFVKNTDELAAVLSHEASHTIHHDAMNHIREQQKIYARAVGASILLGPTLARAIAIRVVADLHTNGYSRALETSADLTGADLSGAAGYNPYGMIWLMQDFEASGMAQGPELLSDHPSFESRIRALENHVRENPTLFSGYSPDRNASKSFRVLEDAPVVFLRH